jgi:hypothetical protein
MFLTYSRISKAAYSEVNPDIRRVGDDFIAIDGWVLPKSDLK